MTTRLNRLLLLCILTISPLFAIAPQYENQPIEKVYVNINAPNVTSRDEEAVKSHIQMKEGEFFSQNAFDIDLKSLAQEYNQVEPRIESIDGSIHIYLDIWPKPTIRSISYCGNSGVKTRQLNKELGVSNGAVYDRKTFSEAFRKLKQYYVKQGYFEAQLDYTVSVDDACNQADITVTIEEGRAGKIEKICFRGFSHDEKCELLNLMYTKEYSFFFSWMTEQGTYDEDMIQADQHMIINFLHDKGYADAKVEIEVRDSDCSNRIVLTINAERGTRYSVGRIFVEGNCVFTDEDISKRLRIWNDGPYSPQGVRDSICNIQDLYGRCGYIDALVDYEPRLRPDCPIYDIYITVSEGDQYRVGLIKVFGNCSTFTNTILHETLLIPGEVFNTDKIKATEARLRNMGFFKCVNVYAVRSEGASVLGDCYRDVHVEVEEKGTGNISAFAGLSTMESVFAGVKLTENNFNWRGICRFRRDGFRAFRGAGEYAHLTGTWGAKSRNYILSWTKPYFNDTKWSVGFDISRSSNRYVTDAYEIQAGGISIYALYQNNAFLRTAWHYRLTNSSVFLDQNQTTVTPLMLDEARLSGLISATGVGFTYDSTDSLERPTQGFRSKLEGEIAGLGGDHAFLSTGYLNTYYFQIAPKGVLKLRADVKFLQPIGDTDPGDIPLEERYFLGGDEMVRGFRPYFIGPKYTNNDPRGGISLQFLSAEYDYRVFSNFDVFTFIDAGHLSLKPWNFGRLSTAVGWGIKFKAMANGPPIVLGFGYPLNATNDSEIKRFFISMGSNF